MAKEIEKKVLLEGRLNGSQLQIKGLDGTLDLNDGAKISQGYLSLDLEPGIKKILEYPAEFRPSELRLRQKGNKYFMTAKGEGTIERDEYESGIDEKLFQEYWGRTEGKRVCKIRMKTPYKGYTFEVDYFTDRELILGEIEFPSLEEAMKIDLPGKDVTADKKYKNKNLAK